MKPLFIYVIYVGIATFIFGITGQQVFAQTDTTAPAVPRGFDAAGGATAYQLVLTWINPADEDLDHINVYLHNRGAYQAPSVYAQVAAQPNTRGTYTFANLSASINHYVYIAAVDTSGNKSAYTAELERTTAFSQDMTTPAAPANFAAADAQTGGSVRLTWTTPADTDFFQTRLHRATEQEFTPASGNEIAQVFGQPSALANYTDTGLTNGTTYYYKIRSEDVRGNIQTGLFYPSASAVPTYVAPPAQEQAPQEETIQNPEPDTPQPETLLDGDLIRAQGTQDIFIVKITSQKKFKRLILNPAIFNSYGHLRWDAVKDVPQATVDSFTTSELVMEVNADGTPVTGKVYKVSSTANSDTGTKQWLNITPAQFEAQGYDWDAIYKINHTEAGESFYPEGSAITS